MKGRRERCPAKNYNMKINSVTREWKLARKKALIHTDAALRGRFRVVLTFMMISSAVEKILVCSSSINNFVPTCG